MYDIQIRKLIKLGLYPSRSEIVRIAVRELLQKDLEFLAILSLDHKNIKKQIKTIKEKKKITSIFIPKEKRKEVGRLLLKLGIEP